nr:N-acetylgalactosamine-6-sulfatase-like [Penaeus vannamei]
MAGSGVRIPVGVLFLFSIVLPCLGRSHNVTRPNIVIMLMDDMGWGDLGYLMGSRGRETPNIDLLARGGMSATAMYTAAHLMFSRDGGTIRPRFHHDATSLTLSPSHGKIPDDGGMAGYHYLRLLCGSYIGTCVSALTGPMGYGFRIVLVAYCGSWLSPLSRVVSLTNPEMVLISDNAPEDRNVCDRPILTHYSEPAIQNTLSANYLRTPARSALQPRHSSALKTTTIHRYLATIYLITPRHSLAGHRWARDLKRRSSAPELRALLPVATPSAPVWWNPHNTHDFVTHFDSSSRPLERDVRVSQGVLGDIPTQNDSTPCPNPASPHASRHQATSHLAQLNQINLWDHNLTLHPAITHHIHTCDPALLIRHSNPASQNSAHTTVRSNRTPSHSSWGPMNTCPSVLPLSTIPSLTPTLIPKRHPASGTQIWSIPLTYRYYEQFAINRTTGESNMTRLYTQEAVKFIEQVAGKSPFFLYWAPDSTHAPTYASKDFLGTSRRDRYGDAVRELDAGVGAIVGALRKMGVAENTLVVFSSDNGAALVSKRGGGSNGPFLCGKQTTFEGGMRTPGIFWWPGVIPAGTVTHQVWTQMDLFSTAIELAGGTIPEDRKIDGLPLARALQHPELEIARPVFFYRGDRLMAVRLGGYKLHVWTWSTPTYELQKGINYCPGAEVANLTTPTPTDHSARPILFNIEADPGERYPVPPHSQEYSKQVPKLLFAIIDHRRDLKKGEPQLNWCDPAVMHWAPPGCDALKTCLPVPPSKPTRCYWPH